VRLLITTYIIGKRNQAAHTFLRGVTRTYDAPSVTRENFLEIYELLKLFEREIKQLK